MAKVRVLVRKNFMKITMLAILLVSFVGIIVFCCSCSTSQSSGLTSPVLMGKIERKMIENPQYPWFQENSASYTYNNSAIEDIKKKKENIEVVAFVGLWCGDCQRQLPPFCKIMEKAEIQNFQMIGLDRQKKSSDGLESSYNIERVPTFIFLKQGKEIGRIIEFPKKTLEEDTLEILSQN